MLVYDMSGRVSVQIIDPSIANFAAGNRLQGTAEENKAAVQGTVSYFGTYTVDEASHTITHHVECSMFPNYNGTDQKRMFTLNGDELKLVTQPLPYPGGPVVGYLVWKRAK
jgi:hypothetical protein